MIERKVTSHKDRNRRFVPEGSISKKYTANDKHDSAYRCVDIDIIFETARFELVGVITCEPR